MRKLLATTNRRIIVVAVVLVMAVLAFLVVNQVQYVRHAHQTFENYYAFRGCVKLLSKTNTDATCMLKNGQTIKMVLYQNKWYLDGDLPVCWFSSHVCF